MECLDWAAEVGFDSVEVSRGVAPMTLEDKHDLLRLAAERFVVLTEVGSKDPAQVLAPEQWTHEVAGDLAAGARWVITEGRETGPSDLPRGTVEYVRDEVVAAAVRGGGVDSLLFEAPRKDQQAWLVRAFGPDVNLANIPAEEVVALEPSAPGAACRHRRPLPPVAAGVTDRVTPGRRNVVPGAYRGVAVSSVPGGALDEESLRAHFLGRTAYRFIVVRQGQRVAVVAVQDLRGTLFSPITGLQRLVGPDDCAYVEDPEVDTAIPTALARAAARAAPGQRGVVVMGRYGHVSFIIDPAPLRITVQEVAPPYPAKLLDQAQRVGTLAEELPPHRAGPRRRRARRPGQDPSSGSYLLPCRGGGVSVDGATTDYLDERPDRREWTLIGCERSQQIHESFYGERAPQVDICPRKRPGGAGAVLTKCCLLETRIEVDGGRAVVPWGATLGQIPRGPDDAGRAVGAGMGTRLSD